MTAGVAHVTNLTPPGSATLISGDGWATAPEERERLALGRVTDARRALAESRRAESAALANVGTATSALDGREVRPLCSC
jgi:hypothetical protein